MTLPIRLAAPAHASRPSQLGAATFCATLDGENAPEDAERFGRRR